MNGLLYFEDNGRLNIDHECEMCMKFPLENLNEPCLSCGVSQGELLTLEKHVQRVNKSLDLMNKFGLDEEGDVDVREAFLHLSAIQLGEGLDQLLFTDIDQNDEIRGLADLTEHMCTVVIYPTNIRHVEGDDYIDEEDWEDEE